MTDLQEAQPETIAEAAKPAIAPEDLNDDQRLGLELMQEVCAATGQEVSPVVLAINGAYMHVDLTGSDVRMTWGRMGQSLDALQFLCNLILSRRIRSDVRMMLDADNYRERRADTLKQRAVELANEVKARSEEAEFEPMPAHERRIIHSALAEDTEIETYSEGDEPARRIVISPRK